MAEITIRPVENPADAVAGRRCIFGRAVNRSVFLSPEWLEAWAAGLPRDVDLWTVEMREGASLLLSGAFGVQQARRPALIGARGAFLHETGSSDFDAIYQEYNDFLLTDAAPADARERALWATLDAVQADEFVIRNARPPLAAAAQRVAAERGHRLRILNRQPTFQIRLVETETVLAQTSASLRAQIRRSIKRYEDYGPLVLTVARDDEQRSHIWRELMRLHTASWNQRGKPGVFSNPALIAFHERFIERAAHKVGLVELRAGEVVIGCLYNLLDGGSVLNYQSGFRHEEDNRLKPGLVTHALAAQRYSEQGYARYDFLGGEALYKRRFANEGEPLTSLVIERSSGAQTGVRRTFRRMRETLRRAETHQT